MIKFEKLGQVGRILLDRPKALNALNQETFRELKKSFLKLQEDQDIALILLDSTNPKAFCAGGDIKEMYEEYLVKDRNPMEIFENEFVVDKLFARGKKPLISYWRGITMGGGIGLSIESDFIIVDDSAVVAMPETQLGFVPDVGMGYYFSKMKKPLGLYLSMVGASVSGQDVVNFGWADVLVSSKSYESILSSLEKMELLDKSNEEILSLVVQMTKEYELEKKETPLDKELPFIQNYFDKDSVFDILQGFEESKDEFGKKTYKELLKKCPTSLVLAFEKYETGKHWTKEETFDQDLKVVEYCCKLGNAKEGIRTTIVDKDDRPKWNPPFVKDVDVEEIKALLKEDKGKSNEQNYYE